MKNLHNRVSRKLLLERLKSNNSSRTTFSFYKYAHIKNPEFFRDHLYSVLSRYDVFGRIYVSKEGINGQISVPVTKFEKCKSALYSVDFLDGCRLNQAIEDDGKSFFKLTIKVREKIVADGLSKVTFDVTDRGKHIGAKEFNVLADAGDTVIVDMRNHYESEVGHFAGALCPDVETFRESLPLVEEMLASHKDKNILMYCTGGIRCEKASAYFKNKGFKKIHQLDGGIIEYTRQCEQNGLENKFIGKNFVFDERLGERISEDVIAKCYQCGKACDMHRNCANDQCHILFIQCEECADRFQNCCSKKCYAYNALSETEKEIYKRKVEFNGTNAGKGRYNALNINEALM